jgi:hypothetical protein
MPMINFKQYDGPSPVHSHLYNFRRWKLGLAKSAGLVGVLLLSVLIAQASLYLPSLSFSGADADTEALIPSVVEPFSSILVDLSVNNPSPSNTVLLAFGKDLDADGELASEEIKYQVGWDAGEWVEYPSNAVDSIPLTAGVNNNRFSKYLKAGDWNLANLIVRGHVSGKVCAAPPPTIFLFR